MAPLERKLFIVGLFILAQLALSVSSADSKKQQRYIIDQRWTRSEEEDCVEEPEPEPEGAAKKNGTSSDRQGKELTLGNPNDKYTLGNATAEPEPEGTGHNGTTGSGTNDKLTRNNSTTEAPATGTGSSVVATLSAVLGSVLLVL
ncbi:hypothetical protein Ocin01_13111 [Orchesella cincta]|uniref:Uncharacterized protein n=1 Tax=Orchesella cincta TaxID=48709 RepID=A0A1D2MKN6_ORCCI|nr:hypothetical protein Ocin01_13111 [Orchesella cincta]